MANLLDFVHQTEPKCNSIKMLVIREKVKESNVHYTGVWPSGLVRWLVDFERTVDVSNPDHD